MTNLTAHDINAGTHKTASIHNLIDFLGKPFGLLRQSRSVYCNKYFNANDDFLQLSSPGNRQHKDAVKISGFIELLANFAATGK